MIGSTISHYTILEKLGEGGMGVVYKAQDTKLKRTVALKFLPSELTRDPEAKKRFIHEAQAASALDHSNICTIHEVDETDDGQVFIAMACYGGETLKEKISKGPLPVKDTMDIAIQMAQGLQEAHDKKIIHRDIKSANVMVTDKGQVKIMDFGLAKLTGQTVLTKEGSTLGTVAYMSPEQAQGKKVDHRSDIWSLGVILYEMITGRRPFQGDYDQAVMYTIVNEDPEPLTGLRTGVPLELEQIVRKTLAKNPAERYQHADELLVDLRQIQKVKGKVKKPRQSKSNKKRIAVIIFAVVLTIVFAAVVTHIINKQRSKFVANRIIVIPFENKTGDESMDMLGQMAAEIITQEMSKISELEAVPFISVLDSYSPKKEKSSAFTIAAQQRAGVLITGSFYSQGEDLFFQASIMDAEKKKVLKTPSSVKGSSRILDVILERLCSQILGALAVHFNYDVLAGQTYIPSFEAFKEFQIGREIFGSDYDKARSHFYKAVEIDSAYTIPLLWIAVSYSNQRQYARVDSILNFVDKHREELPLFDRLMLDYLIAQNSGNSSKVMRCLREAEELAPRSYYIKLFIGWSARTQNLPQLTINTYTEWGYERMAEEIRGYIGLQDMADALYMLGEYQDALDIIHFSRQHFPDNYSSLRYEAILQAALDHVHEVYRIIDESFQFPGSAPGIIMVDAAEALRAHGYKEDAHEVLKRALTWYNSRITGDHQYPIAQVLYLDEQWSEAQQFFTQLYQEFPNNQNYLGYTGVVAARLGETEKANRILEKLYSKDESYLFGSHLHWCARISTVLGEHQRAVDLLREAYGQGRNYDMHELLEMDFELLRDYEPYIELMRPKG